MTTETTEVTVNDRTVTARHGRVQVRDYVPSAEISAAPFVWVHGGGFGAGSLDMAESHMVAMKIAATGRRVTTVDYHLVPRFPLIGRFRMKPSEHRYPVPVDDVTDVFLDVAARHPDRGIVLGGASAGACLAASAAIRLRDSGAATPTGLVLIYGLFHARLPAMSQSLRSRLRGIARLGVAPEMTRRMTLNYAGTEAVWNDPGAFPGTADVHGLPPTLMLNADHDALRASGDAFAEHLRSADVRLDAFLVPGARHGFLDKPHSEGFNEGITTMTEWLDRLKQE
ncbi:alpha/beta hydrolase [Streptomyces sp. ME02-7008A-1]|uniref:alpha/beta hydrolase n=1 Tax=unclassified Streptomyces TaxID=2593676 RepID=UPI0029BBCB1A|nr:MULTISPECIES: alpha/beta hydrolase [unclassified Streptomyces]MDX3179666.1 alpha/beta hydrolase [Streptomyces sp. ME02-7008A-1]MDX3300407.1 alpha/beta hydrolase [Streptomyces sp. ME02-7008A]